MPLRSVPLGNVQKLKMIPLTLVAHTALMCRRNFHVFSILRHGAPGDLDTLGLQPSGNLFIGERVSRVFLFNHFLYSTFYDQQRRVAARWTLNAFRKEVTQFENALRRVGVLISDGSTHC